MKAYTQNEYGGPEVLQWSEVERPALQQGQILVKIKANSVNPADWHMIRGIPRVSRLAFGLFKPRVKVPGIDFAGVVEEVGDGVTRFKAGDKVFGETIRGGAFAEYVSVDEHRCARMPEGAEFSEMACVPIAGQTAWQAVMIHGQLKAGESVLVHGASGGVGHFAVQIARACGASVTGVCSARNSDYVRSLGADQVIEYDRQDIQQLEGNYDLVVDTHGNLGLGDYRRLGRRGVMVGFTTMGHLISVLFKKSLSKYPLAQFTAKVNPEDLESLAALIQQGKIKVHIDRNYPCAELPEAIRYIEAMRTRGKVAVSW